MKHFNYLSLSSLLNIFVFIIKKAYPSIWECENQKGCGSVLIYWWGGGSGLLYLWWKFLYIIYLSIYLAIYRVLILCFSLNVVIFLNSTSCAAALVFALPLCTHTDTTEGKPRQARVRRPESGIYFKIFEITLYLLNTLYNVEYTKYIVYVNTYWE